ncbi:MAG: 30S ribosomal protein S12 methylthiotransferase RimO [Eubacteriales bacterium]|nr:30S ribosomal protein S12 methylthiotransferase RimO [Eubacteriales bacterium]
MENKNITLSEDAGQELSCHLLSLGCDKNLVDAEKMLGMLLSGGCRFTDDPARAELIIVNTCCFIGDAKEESVQAILEMAEYKKTGSCRVLIVTGCMAERYRDEILETLPEVDGVVGTNAYQNIVDIVRSVLREKRQEERFAPISEAHFAEQGKKGRIVTTGGHYAYLKIAEGCNKRCTYCIIPYLRGNYRSVPMEELAAEAGKLAADGVKELVLVAQETTLYGVDLYGKKSLPKLLETLNAIDGIEWIRILYCYPEEITDELVEAIRTLPKVCHYLDIPIQHASDHILRRMARKTTRAEITERIATLRKEIPDIALRTTMISGFPGETDADHQILLEFVREMEFDRLGDFSYSREEGTKAAAFSHQVSRKRKEARREEVMLLQQELAFRKAESRIGKRLRVLIEGRVTDAEGDGNVYAARTYMDAPGVDGLIYINTGSREFMTGDMPWVRVTAAHGYDLIGELCG